MASVEEIEKQLEEQKEKLKQAKLEKRKREKLKKDNEFLKKRVELESSYSSAVSNGLEIVYGDTLCHVYKVFDKDSLRYLGARGEISYIAIDKKNKAIHKDNLDKVLIQFIPEEMLEILPRTRSGNIDLVAVLASLPICKIDFSLDKPFEFTKWGFTYFNLYTPPTYLSCKEGENPKEFKDFVRHLFPVKLERMWALSYLKEALVSRCVSKQLYLVGQQGAGKGVLYEVYKTLFSEGVVIKGSPKTLDKQFKPDLSKLRLIYIDEFVMKEGDVSRAEARAISEEEVAIEQKFFDEKTVKSNTSFILSSNEISKLCFTPSERRPLVPTLATTPLEEVFGEEWIDSFKENFKRDTYKKGVFDFLMKFPKLPRAKIHTRSLETITLASAPKACGNILDAVLRGQYSHLKPNKYYPVKEFTDGVRVGRMKDSTLAHWLSSFIWYGERFFEYNPQKPFFLKWKGCKEKYIQEYVENLIELDME